MVISMVRARSWLMANDLRRGTAGLVTRRSTSSIVASQSSAEYRPIAPRNVSLPSSSFLRIRNFAFHNLYSFEYYRFTCYYLFIIEVVEVVRCSHAMRKVNRIRFSMLIFRFLKKKSNPKILFLDSKVNFIECRRDMEFSSNVIIITMTLSHHSVYNSPAFLD